MKLLYISLLVAAVATPALGRSPEKAWRKFVSAENDYTCFFPGNWHPLPPDQGNLNVVSFPLSRRLRGSIVPYGGAQIFIAQRPDDVTDIESWIRHDRFSADQMSRTRIVLERASPKQPLQLIEVISDWGESGSRFEDVNCYFEISGHFFKGSLSYWKDDPKSREYLAVLHKIVESVRVSGEASQ